jgi:phage terminase large subunit
MIKAWISERTLFIEHEAWEVGCDIDRLPILFDAIPGSREHASRADNARPETISYLQRHGFPNMESVEKWSGSVEDGIAHLRSYEKIVIHPRCTNISEEFRLYAYKVDRLSGDVLPIVIDAFNHGLDSLRYALGPLIRAGDTGFLAYLQQQVKDAQEAKTNRAPEIHGEIAPGVQLGSALALSPAEIAHIRRTQGNPIH